MKVRNKLKLKKGDLVEVITGSSKGKRGRILEIFPEELKARVEGINLQKVHRKPTMKSQGGISTIEGKIHISNLVYCLSEERKGKIGYRESDGKKVRFLKKTNENVD
jgi:large subunit ribosomal protein L24